MLKAGRCRADSRVCSARLKKLRPRTVRPLTGRGWVRRSERPDAGREVVQTGEVFEVAAVATEQDMTEVGEAVDVLFDGSKGIACWTLLMFYLAVVLESGDVVGGGLDAQDEGEFVIDLDRGFAKAMLEAGALDPGCKLTGDLLGELGSDLVAKEGGYVFGFDGQDGLPGKLFIERLEDGLRAEHQISGVLDLRKAPVVGRSEDVEHRTALLGITIEDAMPLCGRELIGQRLRPLPVVDAHKGIVGKRKADPGGGEFSGQPAMSVAIELQAEWTPGRHAQIDQAELGVDEVEVIMQAFTGSRAQEVAMGFLAVPGLVGGAGFHRRNDMHQAGVVAARGQHRGNYLLLADVTAGKVFDGNAGGRSQLGSALAHEAARQIADSRRCGSAAPREMPSSPSHSTPPGGCR